MPNGQVKLCTLFPCLIFPLSRPSYYFVCCNFHRHVKHPSSLPSVHKGMQCRILGLHTKVCSTGCIKWGKSATSTPPSPTHLGSPFAWTEAPPTVSHAHSLMCTPLAPFTQPNLSPPSLTHAGHQQWPLVTSSNRMCTHISTFLL